MLSPQGRSRHGSSTASEERLVQPYSPARPRSHRSFCLDPLRDPLRSAAPGCRRAPHFGHRLVGIWSRGMGAGGQFWTYRVSRPAERASHSRSASPARCGTPWLPRGSCQHFSGVDGSMGDRPPCARWIYHGPRSHPQRPWVPGLRTQGGSRNKRGHPGFVARVLIPGDASIFYADE